MNSTLDLVSELHLLAMNAAPNRSTIVLQPTGIMNQETLLAFQQQLETALEQAIDAVIVDFLWIESMPLEGIAVMAAAMHYAKQLGKALSFQSLDSRTKTALDLECDRLREQDVGTWIDSFEQELETFLDNFIQP